MTLLTVAATFARQILTQGTRPDSLVTARNGRNAVFDPCEAIYCDDTSHWIKAGRAL
jgi:hypothetical protein